MSIRLAWNSPCGSGWLWHWDSTKLKFESPSRRQLKLGEVLSQLPAKCLPREAGERRLWGTTLDPTSYHVCDPAVAPQNLNLWSQDSNPSSRIYGLWLPTQALVLKGPVPYLNYHEVLVYLPSPSSAPSFIHQLPP